MKKRVNYDSCKFKYGKDYESDMTKKGLLNHAGDEKKHYLVCQRIHEKP